MRWIWRRAPLSPSTLQGADQGDTTTIVETDIAAAEQIEDAQAAVPEPQPLEEIIADKGGNHSNQTMVDLDVVAFAPTWRSRTGGDATGRRSLRPRRRCMAIVAGFGDDAAAADAPNAASGSKRSFAHLYDTGGNAPHASAGPHDYPEAPG